MWQMLHMSPPVHWETGLSVFYTSVGRAYYQRGVKQKRLYLLLLESFLSRSSLGF